VEGEGCLSPAVAAALSPTPLPRKDEMEFYQMNPFEEMQRRIAEELGRRRAHYEEVRNLFKTADAHTLHLLKTIVGSIATSEYPERDAARIEGVIIGHLEERGVCSGCGRDHLLDEYQRVVDEGKEVSESPLVKGISSDHSSGELAGEALAAALTEYRLRLRSPSDATDKAVTCVGCGMVYPSLDDRMLSPPDDCSGCRQKAAWG
jgi:hypothetical protein